MIAVAIHAMGRERIAPGNRFPVQRIGVLLVFITVAGTALNLGQRRFVGQVFAFEVGVAGSAGKSRVNGGSEFFAVHVTRDRAPVAGGGQGFVTVAGEAIIVGNAGSRRGARGGQQEEQTRPG